MNRYKAYLIVCGRNEGPMKRSSLLGCSSCKPSPTLCGGDVLLIWLGRRKGKRKERGKERRKEGGGKEKGRGKEGRKKGRSPGMGGRGTVGPSYGRFLVQAFWLTTPVLTHYLENVSRVLGDQRYWRPVSIPCWTATWANRQNRFKETVLVNSIF